MSPLCCCELVLYSTLCCIILSRAVGGKEPQDLDNYGDELSGWWLLLQRLNPFRAPPKIPDMQDISSRLAYISCNMQLNEVVLVPIVSPPATCLQASPNDCYQSVADFLPSINARCFLTHRS